MGVTKSVALINTVALTAFPHSFILFVHAVKICNDLLLLSEKDTACLSTPSGDPMGYASEGQHHRLGAGFTFQSPSRDRLVHASERP